MEFPKGFVWGAGTSSFQIEGAANVDGKGPSIWDHFCRIPGAIADGSTGDTATDHYHHFPKDIDLMKQIGLQAYRFSISWPRVLPEGTGQVNEAGMAFYEKLVDLLLANGIQPWITLFHWDYPQRLLEKGGWLNDRSPAWFADYVRLIVDRLSDRVTHWITLNEPQVFIGFGHQAGDNAPGLKLPFSDILKICHNSLLAHGKAVQIIRERARKKPFIGVAPVGVTSVPATSTLADIEAARSATWSVAPNSCWNNAWFGDPMILGRYPDEGLRIYGGQMPSFPDSDMELIKQPLDFYGTNIYTADLVQASESGSSKTSGSGSGAGWKIVPPPAGIPRTSMDWPVVPESL